MRVEIIGDHPHRGEYGETIEGGLPIDGTYLHHVRLEDCRHGVATCMAATANLRQELILSAERRRPNRRQT